MIKRDILAFYYLFVVCSTLLALHKTAKLIFQGDGDNPYYIRIFWRLLFLTHIGGFINFLYALFRLIAVCRNKVDVTPFMEVFYRQVLILNVIVAAAYWGLKAVNPSLVRSEEDIKLITPFHDHLLHTVNPFLPWIDVLLIPHVIKQGILHDILLQLTYNSLYQGL